jgi:hypothetical protein
VGIARPALEFSELRDASRGGFALRGSGTGTVTTPPLYRPGSTVTVATVRGGGSQSQSVEVGSDCRLRLTVPLGPGNPYQQYSAEAGVNGIQQAIDDTAGVAPSSDISGTAVYTTRVRISSSARRGCRPGGRR